MKITRAQKALLIEAVSNGDVVVNGRRMLAAEGLEKAGFATTKTWIQGPRWAVRVTPTEQGKSFLRGVQA